MDPKRETPLRTLGVTLVMCLVCSVLVTAAAVSLRPWQDANRELDRQQNILAIAGLYQPGVDVRAVFDERVTALLVDLDTGRFSEAFDPARFDPLAAARDPALSQALARSEDTASLRRRERYSVVYRVEKPDAAIIWVLPVRGYGLWSTMYGFVALESDLQTVAGFGFYEQGETAGLGGEVDNPAWKAQWPGKQLLDETGGLVLQVIKGHADPASEQARRQVDGVAGATLTMNGVNHLLQFWLGEQGFGPFLKNLKRGEA